MRSGLVTIPVAFFLAFGAWLPAGAQEAPVAQVPELQSPVEAPAADPQAAPPAPAEDEFDFDERRRFRRNDARVSMGSDAVLAEGESADSVVAILGNASSAGSVSDSVVSVMGNTRVTGDVGESAVAILGNVYVNGRVNNEVVAILGDVELGPDADIGEDVVVIGGSLIRDPAARIGGQVQNVATGLERGDFGWIRSWVSSGLLYGRPLALAPGLEWAWALALGFLALYVLAALLFAGSVNRCVATLDQQPGKALLASLLSVLLTPIVFMLLVVTVIGIAIIPFLAFALFLAGLFGKLIMLAWIGRRGTRFFGDSALNHPAVSVLLGGIVVTGLYLVPVVGFVVYKLLGIVGFGVVAYTVLLAWQESHPPETVVLAGPGGSASPGAIAGAVAPEGPPADTSTVHAAPSPAMSALHESSLPRAGFWIRMGALFIDALLVGAVFALIDWPGSSSLLLLASYGAVMWKLKGTTIGGVVCSLKVVRLDGRAIDWPTAIVRALSCFLSLIVAGLGFIWVVFDPQKQSWHDKIAGTTIVRMPKGVSLV